MSLDVLSKKAGWYKIKCKGKVGWVYKRYFKLDATK
jgi:hypothetical protein